MEGLHKEGCCRFGCGVKRTGVEVFAKDVFVAEFNEEVVGV